MQSQTFACFVSGKKLDEKKIGQVSLKQRTKWVRRKKAYHFMLENGVGVGGERAGGMQTKKAKTQTRRKINSDTERQIDK